MDNFIFIKICLENNIKLIIEILNEVENKDVNKKLLELLNDYINLNKNINKVIKINNDLINKDYIYYKKKIDNL